MASSRIYYIVGHRGTGKTTAAQLASERLDWPVVDLDDVIERREGESCAEIIAESEEKFRGLERRYRRAVVKEAGTGPTIVVLGGGYHPVPEDGVVVWLYRDGWVESARTGREQLSAERDFIDEIDWMIEAREPRWEASAHVRLDVPRGRGPERVAVDLATHLDWLERMEDSPLTSKSWVVAAESGQLEAADRQADLLGLAGVEVRSDLVDSAEAVTESAVLASLRTDDPSWLRERIRGGAAAIDVDAAYLDGLLDIDFFDDLPPRPLIVSSHPDSPDTEAVDEFERFAERLNENHPRWRDQLIVKFAPVVGDYADFHRALDLRGELRDRFDRVTFLPQGDRFAWSRPPLGLENATNYVPVGVAPHRRGHTDNPVQTPLDLQAWLPHLTPPAPRVFEGLIGDPVRDSQGDVWHRRASRDRSSYLKIPAGEADLDELLAAVERFPVRGLSVTSPHKRWISTLDRVDHLQGIEALNTLRRREPEGPSGVTWRGIDTDRAGMSASLEAAEEAGFGPGTVAVIGTGGVAPAIVRAIEGSEWVLVHHARGRAGWTDEAPNTVDMVVNAIGDRNNAYEEPPACEVWLDLHYTDVRPAPEGVELHLNGDTFFDAQAEAQRAFWMS